MKIGSDYPLIPNESFRVVTATMSFNISGTGLTNIVDVSETGILSSIGINHPNSGSSSLEIQIDGQTTVSIPLYSAGARSDWLLCYYADSAALNYVIPIGIRYAVSLRVGINVTGTGSGTLKGAVTRGVKI